MTRRERKYEENERNGKINNLETRRKMKKPKWGKKEQKWKQERRGINRIEKRRDKEREEKRGST